MAKQPKTPSPGSPGSPGSTAAAAQPHDSAQATDRAQRLALYRWMSATRWVERLETELTSAGEAFFHLPAAGHEAVAALALFLEKHDWTHIHYRDKAMMLARGMPIRAYFDSLLTNADSVSHGGQMACFHCDASINLPSTVVPVGNHCLQSVGIAAELRDRAARGDADAQSAIVLVGLGDGSTQQGEVYEAIHEAVRRSLPVLFYVMDNGYAISTPTAGRTFYDLPTGPADTFLGLPIERADARDIGPDLPALARVVHRVRSQRGPALLVLRCDRLTNHTNADDQRVYREADALAKLKGDSDPLTNYRHWLVEVGSADDATLDAIDAQAERDCRAAVEQARSSPEPTQAFEPKSPMPASLLPTASEYRGRAANDPAEPRLLMLEAMREVLRHRLATDPRVLLMGEDIEDPKGDVFGLTRGLSTDYPGRVQNSALSEAIIVGTGIGRAMAGGRPVGFIQFADFLPNGISQIMSEMGTIYWRSGGQYQVPLILMITCGGYRPGLGPFHSQTFESIIAHLPGVDVMMPSDAGDAAGMLNAAFESQRPTVFFYPKVCLNDRSTTTSPDASHHLVPIGKARHFSEGDALTLVTWGSPTPICRDVVDTIRQQTGERIDAFDLRTLSPWDKDAVTRSAARTRKLLIVHEDNLSVGFGAEVAAWVAEHAGVPVTIKRLARPDVPLPCNFTVQLAMLPSYRRILSEACTLIGIDVAYPEEQGAGVTIDTEHLLTVEAQGSSPADQVVTVNEWRVKVGDRVNVGTPLSDMEADKAIFELASSAAGVVHELLIETGVQVDVGVPLMRLAPLAEKSSSVVVKRLAREDRGRPVLTKAQSTTQATVRPRSSVLSSNATRVMLSPIFVTEGDRRLTNDDLVRRFPQYQPQDIIKRTGIESRPILGPSQSVLSMAIDAAQQALKSQNLTLCDLTGIVCHTTTPPLNTPSMACMVLAGLDELRRAADPSLAPAQCMVYDVNAACSGWLYALDAAFNSIHDRPNSKLLVITTEALSRVVNPADFDTAILFGDAATATIVTGLGEGLDAPGGSFVLTKPVLSGKADPGRVLTVGFEGQGHIQMDGKKVFVEGVRAMTEMTTRAFHEAGLPLDDLDWLVPHQANRRIFEAVRQRLNVPEAKVVDLIGTHGNTSSSTIPLAMSKSAHRFERGQTIGVCAFGGGFTFGAAILEAM